MQTSFKKNKKKVGILTFHFAYNVGAVLQAYALKKTFNNYCDCSVVNYCPDYHLNQYVLKDENKPLWKAKQLKKKLPKKFSSLLKAIKCYFVSFKNYEYLVKKNQTKKYKSLIKRLFSSPIISSKEDLSKEIEKYQALVVGSDQLWNKHITDGVFDSVYFLDINGYDKEKYSYAVSAGNCLEEKDISYVKEKLKSFNAVSVREKALLQQLNDNDIPASLDVDPTFLLDKKDYLTLEKRVKVKKPFIFVYCFEITEELNSLLKNLQDKYGYEIVFAISFSYQLSVEFPFKCKKILGISPDEFLYCVHHSEMVITNSFHGTAFSVIYQKKFIIVPSSFARNRITELLYEFNLQHHIYGSDNFSVESDWNNVKKIIDKKREKSIEYIKNISLCKDSF